MISPEGVRLSSPPVTVPWSGSIADFENAIAGPRGFFGRRRGAPEFRAPEPGSYSWEVDIYPCTLLPGIEGRMAVRCRLEHDRWVVHQAVLYRGRDATSRDIVSRRRSPGHNDGGDAVARALTAALGLPHATVPEAHDDWQMIHATLHEWRLGGAVVTHGIWLEYDARTEWEEEEVRITLAAVG